MKKIILFTSVIFVFVACNNTSTNTINEASDTATVQALDTTKLSKGAIFYQCPMHPEVTSDKSGTCPKCGMDLEKVEKK